MALLGSGDGDLGVPTINAKKHRRRGPWEAVSEIRECPPSMLKTSTAAPLGGAEGDPRAPIINANKCQRRPPLKGWCRRSESAHHQR
jgi:hypothetical protein